VNPVPIAVSAFGAQFDALAVGIFVLALALAVRGRGRGETLAPALLVGAAVALKQIVVAFVAAFLGFSRSWGTRVRDALLTTGPFLLLVVPYALVLPGPVFRNVIRYASLHGLWGWYYLVRLFGGNLPFPPALVSYAAVAAGSFLAFRLVARGDDGLLAGRVAATVFLALSPGWSFQMLVWPLAFAPEGRESTPATVFSVAGLFVWAEFLRLHAMNELAGLLAWGAVLFWAWRALRRRPSAVRAPVV
jgi:uncharacterized membrane protein